MRGFRAVSTLMLWHVAMVSGTECNGITLPLTSHCCKDGAPDDYGCSATYKCAKGQCIGPTNKLCTDASADKPGDYVCGATESCGRGNCVGATSTLCGTSGSKMCLPTETCCGVTAATNRPASPPTFMRSTSTARRDLVDERETLDVVESNPTRFTVTLAVHLRLRLTLHLLQDFVTIANTFVYTVTAERLGECTR